IRAVARLRSAMAARSAPTGRQARRRVAWTRSLWTRSAGDERQHVNSCFPLAVRVTVASVEPHCCRNGATMMHRPIAKSLLALLLSAAAHAVSGAETRYRNTAVENADLVHIAELIAYRGDTDSFAPQQRAARELVWKWDET